MAVLNVRNAPVARQIRAQLADGYRIWSWGPSASMHPLHGFCPPIPSRTAPKQAVSASRSTNLASGRWPLCGPLRTRWLCINRQLGTEMP